MIRCGSVVRVEGGMVVARLPRVAVGAYATVGRGITADVAGIDGAFATLAAHGPLEGIACGAPVFVSDDAAAMPLGACALGRSIDARGVPLDGRPPLRGPLARVDGPASLDRVAVSEPLWTGVRCIDALLTLGVGSRAGLFGAPGAGKSTLLEAIAAAGAIDAVVIALVGERGREAHDWIARCDDRSTVVCATSDRSAAERWRAARVAFAQARALQARGLDVLLVLDSLARAAAALRELAIAAGEPAGRGGYPPSVFAHLARLVESAGVARCGSVTLVATVLDDGDERDPVSDAARSMLDAHVQLSSALVRAHRFPAIDVPASASRTMARIVSAEHARAAAIVRRAIAALARTEDARSLGIASHEPIAVAATSHEAEIDAFIYETRACGADASAAMLCELAAKLVAAGHEAAT